MVTLHLVRYVRYLPAEDDNLDQRLFLPDIFNTFSFDFSKRVLLNMLEFVGRRRVLKYCVSIHVVFTPVSVISPPRVLHLRSVSRMSESYSHGGLVVAGVSLSYPGLMTTLRDSLSTASFS